MAIIPGMRVVRSSIDGYGVVATRDFAAGEVIAEVEGVLWHESNPVDDKYSLLLGDGYFFDMVDQTRWINHSCDPNCEVDVGLSETGEMPASGTPTPWARVYALRPLRAGDEITYDYAFSAEVAEPCRCGTKLCRGFIVDVDELHLLTGAAAAATG
ncbi:MAG TPA: SET domain-containing protein-lysine N-methyltransferase [Polyangia bacterium]|nr:SET domain-containing protein-lysine N-methyltransferase [Polyangia bacterium]